jgi:integrase/recombinase XerD
MTLSVLRLRRAARRDLAGYLLGRPAERWTTTPTLQAFFTDRLITQTDASPRTIAAYRDTFRLLLAFTARQIGKQPSELDLDDLDNHLQADRGNTARTRNARLAAIHSFCRYAAFRHPEHAATIARVIEIPSKRYDRTDITYLIQPEIDALLAAPDRATWLGRRDHTLILTMITTGLRVSELAALRIADVTVNATAHVHVIGKGRKERSTPLKAETANALRDWLHEREGAPADPVFPTRHGQPLSHDAISKLLAKHTTRAASNCASLAAKRVTPHVLRHTNAMLLQAQRVDIATIALWLGHESIKHIPLPARRQQAQTRSDRPHRPDRHPTRQIPTPRHTPRVPRIPDSYPDQPAPSTTRQAGRTIVINSRVGITRQSG